MLHDRLGAHPPKSAGRPLLNDAWREATKPHPRPKDFNKEPMHLHYMYVTVFVRPARILTVRGEHLTGLPNNNNDQLGSKRPKDETRYSQAHLDSLGILFGLVRHSVMVPLLWVVQ